MTAPLRFCTRVLLLALPLVLIVATAEAQTRTYTLDADFDEGALTGVNHDAPNNDQLQLNAVGEPFEFIWVAASSRGTIIRIDTRDGTILGEYLSAPDGRGRNPSRTTVDANGNVWAGNRDEAFGGKGSVIHVGLEENGQCVDRHGPGGVGPPDGVIQTSSGLGDVLPWTNPGGVDDNGGVSSAEDECIIHYVRTAGTNVRTVAVDGLNNVWVGGLGNAVHELHDANGNVVPGTQFNLGCGGYGGLVDYNGVLWSAGLGQNQVLRYDPSIPGGACISLGRTSYGLGLDTNGYIWNSNWTFDTILKIDPSGAPILGPFPTGGGGGDRGVVVTPADNNVWVANSLGSDVSRLDNAGAFVTTVTVGSNPTGVAVDAAGKVWATNLSSHDVSRIDPATNLVDLTVDLNAVKYNGLDAGPYNYSDMTGSTLTAPPDNGTWTVVYNSGEPGAVWGLITWTADEPGDASITVTAASSTDGITYSTPETVTQGVDLTVPDGQFLQVSVSFTRATTGESPILYDLTINRPPDCAYAYADPDEIWPPNHNFVDVHVLGVTDPDGDAVSILITSIFQDEPLDTSGDGSFEPDGDGVGTSTARVRAERSGTNKVPGNGRVYHIGFLASDASGGECTGVVQTCVPHDRRPGLVCVDEGPLYDSTVPASKAGVDEMPLAFALEAYPNPFNPATTISYTLPEAGHVRLVVYDVMGRAVAQLVDATVERGTHEVTFDASGLPSGVYLVRLASGSQVEVRAMTLLK